MVTYNNQKIIKIPNRQVCKQIIFDKSTIENALKDLDGSALKLWFYFYLQEENSAIALSSIDVKNKVNISKSSYDRSLKELINKNYLVETSRKDYFIFVDNIEKVKQKYFEDMINQNNKISSGEKIISEILFNNNISFVREATFGTCLFEDTKYPAKFDFYVNNKYLIEYDGKQHFSASNRGWNTEEQLIKTQKHDAYKNQWCKDNNIPLIRIPYTHLNDLCIEDLKLETSHFIVN